MPKTFYITTPIYYVNDKPHIGHVYTTTIADILARYHRMLGDEVFFLTGTDEHAAKVVESATQRGLTPQAWADENAKAFQNAFAKLGIKNDDFVRTTQERHKEKVRQYVGELLKSGDVYLGEYEGWYDTGQEEYLPESKAKEYDYKSPFNAKPLVRKKEKNYFFKLSSYGDALLKRMEEHPESVQPDARRNEVINRIREGLNDVPISRGGAGEWGIKVPGDDQHVIYVWIDALINYLSMVDTDARRKFWPANVHLIAKDILWFHAVIWPAMLMALKRPLPLQVYAHSFWIAEGQKMSKSLGNFVDLEKIDQYVAKYGLDAFRYFLAKNGPLGATDSDFADAKFAEVFNADLANDLGNLLSRVVNMTQRFCGGKIPEANLASLDAETEAVRATVTDTVSTVLKDVDVLRLDTALEAIIAAVKRINKYLEVMQPWTLAKKADPSELHTVLYVSIESLRILSQLLFPVMPEKMAQLRKALGLTGECTVDELRVFGKFPAGRQVQDLGPLFPRTDIEDKAKAAAKPAEKAAAGIDGVITYDDFAKVQFRTAKIVEAAKVEGADKLLRLQVEVGQEKRQIVAGIAKHYTPEELVGKTVVMVANLKPAKIRGVESNGMLLAASSGESMKLVTVEGDLPAGAVVK